MLRAYYWPNFTCSETLQSWDWKWEQMHHQQQNLKRGIRNQIPKLICVSVKPSSLLLFLRLDILGTKPLAFHKSNPKILFIRSIRRQHIHIRARWVYTEKKKNFPRKILFSFSFFGVVQREKQKQKKKEEKLDLPFCFSVSCFGCFRYDFQSWSCVANGSTRNALFGHSTSSFTGKFGTWRSTSYNFYQNHTQWWEVFGLQRKRGPNAQI